MGNDTVPEGVLEAYGLSPRSVAPAGGTAGGTWRADTDEGAVFVRMRGPRTSSRQRIAFDHGFRRHLAAEGYATVAPMTTRTGTTCVDDDGGVFEAYPFVPGALLGGKQSDAARCAAATSLARLHQLGASYEAVCEDTVPQFSSYPCGIPSRMRFDAPDAQSEALDYHLQLTSDETERQELERAREAMVQAGRAYAASYAELPRAVVHGDYNCYNLLFDERDAVVGVFDFDWAWREARLFDIATGVFFFGTRRSTDADSGSIWSLTQCPEFDPDGMMAFLVAYHELEPLTQVECEALPHAILARWCSWRLEGAMKVAAERQAAFVLYDFFKPFEWVRSENDALLRRLQALLG
ncbi:MAG: phosphotransferase [bacterium]|nr:phosphotransferase [bacterium]